jgi:F-type H+-transporting ATPase subunit gamma
MSFEEIHQRRLAVETIHDIVNAMRAIAAGRIQGAQRALRAARRYQQVVRQAIAAIEPELLLAASGTPRQSTLLVFTSEQPLCGAFNQNVLALAERRRLELMADEKVAMILVGRRGVRSGRTLHLTPDAVEPAATSILGLRDVMKRLALSCAKRHAAGTLGTLRVIYNRYRSLSEQVPGEEIVFPLERSSAPPAASPRERRFHRYLPAADLYAQLVAEHLFIDLYRLAAESFAGEQASRLIAMDGATRNTERMQTQMLELEQRERQDEITREILELISARSSLE